DPRLRPTCPCHLASSSVSPVPTGASLMLCRPLTRCRDQSYDPLRHCCLGDALVPLGETRQCGTCSYRVCFEQCCPRWPLGLQEPLMVKLRVDSCSSPLVPGDKLCRRCCPAPPWGCGMQGIWGLAATSVPDGASLPSSVSAVCPLPLSIHLSLFLLCVSSSSVTSLSHLHILGLPSSSLTPAHVLLAPLSLAVSLLLTACLCLSVQCHQWITRHKMTPDAVPRMDLDRGLGPGTGREHKTLHP
ncbi:Hypothetical predicted protein, partial [Marmota monax]